MGTRSASGFRMDGRDQLAYNHFDGYPSGAGQQILDELKADIAAAGDLAKALTLWKGLAKQVRIVSDDEPPTDEDIAKLANYTDLSVNKQSEKDWYCLLRELHGTIIQRLKVGYMDDQGNEFIKDSLFCEWAYILNLDEETYEVYEGFQQAKHTKGRYAKVAKHDSGYYACALIAAIPLKDVTAIEDLEKHLVAIGAIVPDKDEEAAAE